MQDSLCTAIRAMYTRRAGSRGRVYFEEYETNRHGSIVSHLALSTSVKLLSLFVYM